MASSDLITIEISPGELIDKLTIAEIRLERIVEESRRRNVLAEWEVLDAAFQAISRPAELLALKESLRGINEALWDIEDRIRNCERIERFDAEFISLARSVYKTNDRRSALKREINSLLASRLTEEKSYQPY